MNDLRKAAEMALEFVEWLCGDDHSVRPKNKALNVRKALRQALAHQALDEMVAENQRLGLYDDEPPCKTDPRAPHGFDRNASHAADRYVCECESWEPVDAVNMSQERVDKTAKSEHEPFIYIREDTEMPFGGYEHCGQHEPGAFPVYLAPPKQEYQYEVVAEHADGTYTTKRIPKRQWVGLTADEIWKCNKAKSGSAVEFHICSAHQNLLDFAEAIESKLKEKNGG